MSIRELNVFVREFQELNSRHNNMTKYNKFCKVITDLIIIAAMIGCWASSDTAKGPREAFRSNLDVANSFSWGTLHSILSIIFTVIILIHIWQHWEFIKGIIIKNLYSKNIVTTITLLTFIVTILSFLVYFTGFNHSKGEFHGTIANIFLLTCCVHLVLNFKKMLVLSIGSLIKEESWLHNYLLKSYRLKPASLLSSLFRRRDQTDK
jgi:hypothetical protein